MAAPAPGWVVAVHQRDWADANPILRCVDATRHPDAAGPMPAMQGVAQGPATRWGLTDDGKVPVAARRDGLVHVVVPGDGARHGGPVPDGSRVALQVVGKPGHGAPRAGALDAGVVRDAPPCVATPRGAQPQADGPAHPGVMKPGLADPVDAPGLARVWIPQEPGSLAAGDHCAVRAVGAAGRERPKTAGVRDRVARFRKPALAKPLDGTLVQTRGPESPPDVPVPDSARTKWR